MLLIAILVLSKYSTKYDNIQNVIIKLEDLEKLIILKRKLYLLIIILSCILFIIFIFIKNKAWLDILIFASSFLLLILGMLLWPLI